MDLFRHENEGRRAPRLAKVSASGGEIHLLNTAGVSNPTEPDWSPDGKWIAFTRQAGDFSVTGHKTKIEPRMNTDGHGLGEADFMSYFKLIFPNPDSCQLAQFVSVSFLSVFIGVNPWLISHAQS